MSFFKYILTRLAEAITGRKCSRCRNNVFGRCFHRNGGMFGLCWPTVTCPGFEARNHEEG